MFNFPHCTICCPFVEYSKQSDLSSPKKKRNLKRKISKRRYRYLCSQGESNQGCCRYKSQYTSRPKRYCRPSVGNCHESRSPRGQPARRRSDRRRSSPQRCSLYSGATWSSTCKVPPNSPLPAPHVERKTNVIDIDDCAIFSDNCPVKDVQQDSVRHINEQPIGGDKSPERTSAHPPNHSQLAQCDPQSECQKAKSGLSCSP